MMTQPIPSTPERDADPRKEQDGTAEAKFGEAAKQDHVERSAEDKATEQLGDFA